MPDAPAQTVCCVQRAVCVVCSVQCAARCAVCSVQSQCSVQCAVCSVQCAVCMCSVQCARRARCYYYCDKHHNNYDASARRRPSAYVLSGRVCATPLFESTSRVKCFSVRRVRRVL